MKLAEIKGAAKEKFLQAKWDYYSKFTQAIVFFGSLASIFYLVSDWQLFGRIPLEVFTPRLFIILPLILYMILVKKVKDYKILSVASLVMCHAIMWCTIGAIVYLPDKTHASEGFVIMNLLFFGVSFGTPFLMSSLFHAAMIFNIFISNLFNHYTNIGIMYSLNIPCIVGIIAASYVMDEVYVDNYGTKKQLERAMLTDALTGCFNRHKITTLVENNSHFIEDISRPLNLILLDIDFFKKVNDTYGHDAGDKVLKYVVTAIKGVIRETDILVRWGGEEFIILLPKCTTEQAVEIAERIRQNVEVGDSEICKVTISLGITKYIDNTNYLDIINYADTALYNAKNTGRNKVIVFENGDLIQGIEYAEYASKLNNSEK